MAAQHDRPLGWDLAAHGERIAVVTESGEVSYGALAERVARAARQLGTGRAARPRGRRQRDRGPRRLPRRARGAHAVLLAPGDNPTATRALITAYDPDVVVAPVDGRWRYEQRRPRSAHALRPDLALLLSTSGSTGSPKLVRLSYRNLRANAESIAEYLGIRATDRAPTTLPMHYCYGLSVINSPRTGSARHYWFLEMLVYIMVAMLAVMAVPALDRWERRRPFLLAVAVLGVGLTVRFDLVELSKSQNLSTPASWFWIFALGWAIGKATGTWQRWLVTVAVAGTVVGHSPDTLRSRWSPAGCCC